MSAALAAGSGDVLWSAGFLARHAPVILVLSAVPATQRVVAALNPDDPRVYAWPVELLVAALRLGAVVVVFRLGWVEDASRRRAGDLGSAGEIVRALGEYARHDWGRLLVATFLAAAVFGALNVLAGPVLELVVERFGNDARAVDAWTFGARNLVTIPLFYVMSYALVRPAFLS